MTYGAEMPVIHHEGMTIVAESPHFFGRNGKPDSGGGPVSGNGANAEIHPHDHPHDHPEENPEDCREAKSEASGQRPAEIHHHS